MLLAVRRRNADRLVRASADGHSQSHGLRFPGRVVGGGGIYLEYDNRDTPDVTTLTIDYREGVQGLVTGHDVRRSTRIPQLIRGHFGSIVFGNGEISKASITFPNARR